MLIRQMFTVNPQTPIVIIFTVANTVRRICIKQILAFSFIWLFGCTCRFFSSFSHFASSAIIMQFRATWKGFLVFDLSITWNVTFSLCFSVGFSVKVGLEISCVRCIISSTAWVPLHLSWFWLSFVSKDTLQSFIPWDASRCSLSIDWG